MPQIGNGNKLVNRQAVGTHNGKLHQRQSGLLKKGKAAAEPPVDLRGYPRDNIRCPGEVVDISWPVPDPMNAKLHGERNIQGIMTSLAVFGQMEPIVIRKENRVVAVGNGRLESLKKLGWTKVACNIQSMTDAEFASYAVADNRSSEVDVRWDFDVLAQLEKIIRPSGIPMVGWTAAEVEMMWKQGREAEGIDPNAGGGDEYEPVVVDDSKAICKPGDFWLIGGKHRLVCGDSTDAATVDRLFAGDRAEMVWTDPPYGVAVGDKNKLLNKLEMLKSKPSGKAAKVRGLYGVKKRPSKRIESNIANDQLDDEGLETLLRVAFAVAMMNCQPGGAWYVTAPSTMAHVFGQVLRDMDVWRQMIVWVKHNSTMAPMGVDYHWRHELMFYGWTPGEGHRYYGGRKQDTVWEIDRPSKSALHPSMKPIELVRRSIENNSLTNQIVYDPFAGAGSTLIAANRCDRICYCIELSPAYADVIISRARADGMHAEKVD